MIVTVTLSTGLDHVLFVPTYAPGRTNRAHRALWSMGGKGTDVSWILGELGFLSRALGFAAGEIGRRMEGMLQVRRVTTDFVWTAGETRVNTVIIEEGSGRATTLTAPPPPISPENILTLREKYRSALRTTRCVVIAGSLPPDVPPDLYTTLIQEARAAGKPVIFDSSGEALSVGLRAGPNIVKPNQHELEGFLGIALPTFGDLKRAARRVHEEYGVNVVLSAGGEGVIAVLDEATYHIPALDVPVVNPAGAGDALVAGLAAAIAQGQPIEEGLRLGVAAATAVVITPGTADCRCEDVERFLPDVQLLPL